MNTTTRTHVRPNAARLAMAAVLVAVILGSIWFLTRSEPRPPLVGVASLTVGGATYDFELTACAMPGNDFLASGRGTDGQETYWLSASGAGIEVLGGTSSEVDQPIDGELWLVTDDPVDWTTTDRGEITVEATLRDHRSPGSMPEISYLDVRCDAS